MKVGDNIFHLDANHRVYRKDKDGDRTGSPIYKEYWREIKIIGETSRSWLVGWEHRPTKVPKKDLEENKLTGYCQTMEEIDRRAFVAEHRHKIAELVRSVDHDQLKAIANIIGYKAED